MMLDVSALYHCTEPSRPDVSRQGSTAMGQLQRIPSSVGDYAL